MAVHSIFGCCVHHAHSHEAGHATCHHSHDGSDHSDDDAEAGHDHAPASHAATSEIPQPPPEGPPVECDEVRCDFLTAAGAKAPHPSDAPAVFDLPGDAAAFDESATTDAGHLSECSPLWHVVGKRCAPTVTQVWRL
ncbi:MAG: hypothetical protein WD069_17340 [Planctomycetales bacterium]